MTRIFASLSEPFLAKMKRPINSSLYPQRLNWDRSQFPLYIFQRKVCLKARSEASPQKYLMFEWFYVSRFFIPIIKPRQRPSTAQSRSTARTSKSSGSKPRPRSAQASQRGGDARGRCADCAARPHSPQASSSARLVEIDSFSQPMEEDAPHRRPINAPDARSESAVAPVAPRNPPRGDESSVIAPGLRKSTGEYMYCLFQNLRKKQKAVEQKSPWL